MFLKKYLNNNRGELVQVLGIIIVVIIITATLLPNFLEALETRENGIIGNQTTFFSSEKYN
jgi:F0F1-type ATP synthase membrane subunit b/b'